MLYLNTAGYYLYEVTNDQWVIHVKDGPIYSGNFKNVIKQAMYRMRFKYSDLDIAVSEMVSKGHNAAHFGMYRGFVYTFQKEFKNVNRQAS